MKRRVSDYAVVVWAVHLLGGIVTYVPIQRLYAT